MCSLCLKDGVQCVYPKELVINRKCLILLYYNKIACYQCTQVANKVCDRVKPICNHCEKGGLNCHYLVQTDQWMIQAEKEIFKAQMEEKGLDCEENTIEYWKDLVEKRFNQKQELLKQISEARAILEIKNTPCD